MDTMIQKTHMDHIIGDKKASLLSKEHIRKARKLWEDTFFSDSSAFLDYYFGTIPEERKIFAVLENDEVLSMIHLQKQELAVLRNDGHAKKEKRSTRMVDMEKMDAGLLTGLATRKKYRHLGLTDEVMRESIIYQEQQNNAITYVIPETELEKEMLKEYGFSVVEEKPVYTRNIKQLSLGMLRACRHGNRLYLDGDETVSVKAVTANEYMSVANFANEQLAKHKGMFAIRNVPYYERLVRELKSCDGTLFLCRKNEEIVGYFAVAGIEGEEDYREIIFAEQELQDLLFQLKKEPGRQVMARIINLQSMMKYMKSDGKVTVAVRMDDPMIRDNNGIFLWYLDEQGCRMERIEDLTGMRTSNMPKPEMSVSIGEFTSFLMGHLSLKDNKKFDSILKVGPSWLTEIH